MLAPPAAPATCPPARMPDAAFRAPRRVQRRDCDDVVQARQRPRPDVPVVAARESTRRDGCEARAVTGPAWPKHAAASDEDGVEPGVPTGPWGGIKGVGARFSCSCSGAESAPLQSPDAAANGVCEARAAAGRGPARATVGTPGTRSRTSQLRASTQSSAPSSHPT